MDCVDSEYVGSLHRFNGGINNCRIILQTLAPRALNEGLRRFHNHRESCYEGLLLVESVIKHLRIYILRHYASRGLLRDSEIFVNLRLKL